jgi:peptidyl-prolyl cis-trans isomerase C
MTLSYGLARHDAEFSYHMLRNALDKFKRNLSELDDSQYEQVRHTADKSYRLESLVLGSPEAKGLVIPDNQVETAFGEVASRYSDEEEFLLDLQSNGLDAEGLRRALHRELMFDAVMQRVAAASADVNDIDMRLFYEMHSDRFQSPELRSARHILITINPDYVENTHIAAMSRIQQVAERLRDRANRFADMAKRCSECPTAMEGGKLGDIRRGTLYPELDAELFRMKEGEISPVVETEVGLHILLCEKIKPGKRTSFSKAAPQIRTLLEERRRRNCQKAWLAELQRSQT